MAQDNPLHKLRESEEENESQRTVRSRSPSPGRQPLTLRVMNLDDAQSRIDAQREEIQSTYVNLMKEFEFERERRWKAEQAAKKLAEHIKEMQSRAQKEQDVQDSAFQATSRLKQNLSNERDIKLRLKIRVQELEEEVRQLSSQLSSSKEIEESSRRSQQTLENTLAKTEAERIRQHTHESKKTLDAQMRSAAMSRELDIMKNTVGSQKTQVVNMQELLANREQEYREELKRRYMLDSPELQDVINKELKRAGVLHTIEVNTMQEKLSLLNHDYAQLEDEFRMALQIEANKFHKVEDAYELVSQSNAENKTALFTAQEKDKKTEAMIREMTALVKEQKWRLTELSKSKHEQQAEYRERVNKLEAHVEEARKRMLQMELLKQENKKMKAQVDAQESVIEGLRSERKIWGQELAQQGVSLAQDRGRLEAKIETQASEMTVLRKYLEKETDTVKIKTKMIEDQTESIRKLKKALLEDEDEVKTVRSDALDVQKQLEEQLNEERTAYQQAQEVIDRLRSRKEEIKQQLEDTNTDLHESQKAHSLLNTRWKEKSDLIGQLEQQVMQMKTSWESKEMKLTEERDSAIETARVAADKLRSIDDAFRTQLDVKENAHQEKITLLIQKKQAETDSAQQRVQMVEDEMRELLSETEANKRLMEEKVKRLTKAFSEIQADLS